MHMWLIPGCNGRCDDGAVLGALARIAFVLVVVRDATAALPGIRVDVKPCGRVARSGAYVKIFLAILSTFLTIGHRGDRSHRPDPSSLKIGEEDTFIVALRPKVSQCVGSQEALGRSVGGLSAPDLK